jgi:hypothetical protein
MPRCMLGPGAFAVRLHGSALDNVSITITITIAINDSITVALSRYKPISRKLSLIPSTHLPLETRVYKYYFAKF